MCIIAVKIKGSDFPSTKIIKQCIERNPDGFSMAWNGADGKVHNYKTMDAAKALKEYEHLASVLDPDKTTFVFHARFATHGSKKVANCHCWIERGIAFAHNGVLINIRPTDDRTDSETFFSDCFMPILQKNKNLAYEVAKQVAGSTNKFVFLDGKGNLEMIGHFVKDSESGRKGCCYYSNTGYQTEQYRFASPLSGGTTGSLFPKRPKKDPVYGKEVIETRFADTTIPDDFDML